ncbi:MAG: S-layer homology domain-containing protein [Anaerovoracaceae bacterium]
MTKTETSPTGGRRKTRKLLAGWAEADMQWAVGAGILSGKGDGRLDPLGSATRGETAAMLQRFLEK